MAASEPLFAVEAGMTALRWLAEGYGYDITSEDVRSAYTAMAAAEVAGRQPETLERIRTLVAGENYGDHFVTKVLGPILGLNK